MRVLVACEFSGIVRDAFAAKGHDAWSCDLLPTEALGNHIQGDVLGILGDGWDLMCAHPPCTHLAVSGARWFKDKRAEQAESIEFFMALATADVPKIVVENPIGIMSSLWRKPDQVIQPWMFGHAEYKATCFWLKGLSPLLPTCTAGQQRPLFEAHDPLDHPERGSLGWKSWNRVHKCAPGPERAKLRSWRFPKIAAAMADQWG